MPPAVAFRLGRPWELTRPPRGSPHAVAGRHRAPRAAFDSSDAPPRRQSPPQSRLSSSRSLGLFVFLPSYGSQRRSRRNLLRPLPISESASHGAQGAAAPKTHGVTSANRNHRVFPRLHDSHTNAVSYVGFPWRLSPTKHSHTPVVSWSLRQPWGEAGQRVSPILNTRNRRPGKLETRPELLQPENGQVVGRWLLIHLVPNLEAYLDFLIFHPGLTRPYTVFPQENSICVWGSYPV